jgi:hypothetical protein
MRENILNCLNIYLNEGVSGRVHISEKTRNFLDGQYLLEEGPEHKGYLFLKNDI